MTPIKLTPAFMAVLDQKNLTTKDLVLIADDGGGKYSLQGGACTIGTNFTLIVLDAPDPDYPVAIANDQGLRLWSSDYDLYFLGAGLTLDVAHHNILLKDDAELLDSTVKIARGQDVLDAFQRGIKLSGDDC
ncbi:iron-sulfur cluster biosynthesis family protein [Levilactobacillus zymae]|uniref:iron-sulfur cluster biosynthesis family protein n=1 Tax=Levilactobacillus zymae TaxID=267363 RepID=UPI0028B7B0B8|nr:iron-sulfur cluster biosynthesis family protein [Levilactobacillus zymae]MDT6979547.1 iron-sulfur cluster biosynthesis family protein [Levilactobacillus zymae]